MPPHPCRRIIRFPKSNPYTQIFCRAAIESIIDVFKHIAAQGPEYRLERLKEMLIASNYAGIAFGNTGVGAVHALSYPLGGNYHVPHGEANYQFFTEVFKFYYKKKPFREHHGKLTHYSHTSWKPTRNTCMKNSITYWVNCYPKTTPHLWYETRRN